MLSCLESQLPPAAPPQPGDGVPAGPVLDYASLRAESAVAESAEWREGVPLLLWPGAQKGL